MTHVLVAVASRRGSTAELAEWIGEALRDDDGPVTADVRDAATVRDLDPYDAVVLGSALYGGRWCRAARRFARRHRRALLRRPVWLFSSGPLDDSAGDGTLPAPAGVRRIGERLAANGVVTFGGALRPGTRGRLARAIADQRGGDFRDRDQVRRWGRAVGAELAAAGRSAI
ncbi:MAG TPA: flavodoxin domain-containing protein [Streptosporangiaceae bacterium]|jgi:menaquinone-dependent protoporphyrinogen oxidase